MTPLHDSLAPGLRLQLEGTTCLHAVDSGLQRIEVWQTDALGRVFTLDGSFMTAEADEFIYHESLVHPAALALAAPRRAVIVGGGDGGSARELLRHPTVERVDALELDPAVVDMARRFLPSVHAGALDDTRVHLRFGDGYASLREHRPRCDLMVLDLSDPQGHAAELYTTPFYRACADCLEPDGYLSLHVGSPLFAAERCRSILSRLRQVFDSVRPLLVPVPLYGGLWMMAVASRKGDVAAVPTSLLLQRRDQRGLEGLRFYQPQLFAGLFSPPPFVQEWNDADAS